MKSNMTTLLKRVAVITGLGLGAFAISALAAQIPFVPPQHAAPDCYSGEQGCDRPVNEGPTSQQKTGSLFVNTTGASSSNGFSAWGISTFWGNVILKTPAALKIEANAAAGKVLTSDASGNATWQSPGGASSFSSYFTASGQGSQSTDMGAGTQWGACFLTTTKFTTAGNNSISHCEIENPDGGFGGNGNRWILKSYAIPSQVAICVARCMAL